MDALAAKMAQSMGFCPNLPNFDKNEQLSFYKVFTEIGSFGFGEFGRASKRTEVSK